MMRLTHWTITKRQEWRIPHISAESYRVSGCIYGHERIKDGEFFTSGSDIQGMVVTENEAIIRTAHSVYYCNMRDRFTESMDKELNWLFDIHSSEHQDGLTVFVDSAAENLIRKICYKDSENVSMTWTLEIPTPRNSRYMLVTCGECAVSLEMIKRSDYAHLCVNGAERRFVKNVGWEKATFWIGKNLMVMDRDEVAEF